MKKKKAVGIDQTRRRFMAYFSGLGLSSTLLPGVLWAKMQETGAEAITLTMVTDSLKLSGVDFTCARTDIRETTGTGLLLFTFVEDAAAPGGFRIDFSFVSP